MGTAPMTCALSGLPIERGDDVLAFITIRWLDPNAPRLNGPVETTKESAPISLPLHGEYPGSSYLNHMETNYNTKILEDRFDIDDWTAFFRSIHDGLIFEDIDDDLFDTCGVGLVMFRRDVVRRIMMDPPIDVDMTESKQRFIRAVDEERWDDIDLPVSFESSYPGGVRGRNFQMSILDAVYPIDGDPVYAGSDSLCSLLYDDMYDGIEHNPGAVSRDDQIRYERDKLEYDVITSSMAYAGRDWNAPPRCSGQCPTWRNQAHLKRIFTDVARDKIGEPRYAADITESELQEWLDLREEFKRRLERGLSDDMNESIDVIDINIDDEGNEVRFTYSTEDGDVEHGSRSTQYIYDP